MQVTIKQISRKERISKAGKPYISLGIKIDYDGGEVWASGFDNAQTKEWKTGDTVEIDLEKKGDFLNFSVPKDNFSTSNVELRNMINLKVIPMLDEILRRLDGFGTPVPREKKDDEYEPNPIAADDQMGEFSPF